MKRLALVWWLVMAACDSATSQQEAAFDLRGDWRYAGSQTAPALEITGTLQIAEQAGSSFSGTAAFTETDVQGTRRTRAGAVSGRIVGSNVLDFDVYIDTWARRHVARATADSASGTWSVTDAASVNGSFRIWRVR